MGRCSCKPTCLQLNSVSSLCHPWLDHAHFNIESLNPVHGARIDRLFDVAYTCTYMHANVIVFDGDVLRATSITDGRHAWTAKGARSSVGLGVSVIYHLCAVPLISLPTLIPRPITLLSVPSSQLLALSSAHTLGVVIHSYAHTYAVCVYWCVHQQRVCVLLNEVKLTSTASRFVQPVDSAGDRLHSCMYGACTLSQIGFSLVPIGPQQSTCLFEHSGTTFHIASPRTTLRPSQCWGTECVERNSGARFSSHGVAFPLCMPPLLTQLTPAPFPHLRLRTPPPHLTRGIHVDAALSVFGENVG